MNPFRLDGRRALVTGAGRGLGEAIAASLSDAGARVIVSDIDGDAAVGVAHRLQEGGFEASALTLDVTDEDAVARAFTLLNEDGGVDVLVNNAGTYLGVGGPIQNLSPEKWRYAIRQNLEGIFLCSRQAAAAMIKRGAPGAIVNITSVDSAVPAMGVGYDTAKAAANHFTRSLAIDLSPHRIRVNAIAPGVIPVETYQKVMSGGLPPIFPTDDAITGLMGPVTQARLANIPLGFGEPSDIGNAVLYFASDAAKYVTGQVLFVDGGWSLV